MSTCSSTRMKPRICAASRGARGHSSRTSSSPTKTGCRPTISRKRRWRSSRIAHRRRTSAFRCWRISPRNDFGYITTGTLLERCASTLETMGKLERERGHFYNWYDTQSLQTAAIPFTFRPSTAAICAAICSRCASRCARCATNRSSAAHAARDRRHAAHPHRNRSDQSRHRCVPATFARRARSRHADAARHARRDQRN